MQGSHQWGWQIIRGERLLVESTSDLTQTVITSKLSRDYTGDDKFIFDVEVGNENVFIGDGGVPGRFHLFKTIL